MPRNCPVVVFICKKNIFLDRSTSIFHSHFDICFSFTDHSMPLIKRQYFDPDSQIFSLVINGFVDKMRNWKDGRRITTDTFEVQGHRFRVLVQPNERQNVGVY